MRVKIWMAHWLYGGRDRAFMDRQQAEISAQNCVAIRLFLQLWLIISFAYSICTVSFSGMTVRNPLYFIFPVVFVIQYVVFNGILKRNSHCSSMIAYIAFTVAFLFLGVMFFSTVRDKMSLLPLQVLVFVLVLTVYLLTIEPMQRKILYSAVLLLICGILAFTLQDRMTAVYEMAAFLAFQIAGMIMESILLRERLDCIARIEETARSENEKNCLTLKGEGEKEAIPSDEDSYIKEILSDATKYYKVNLTQNRIISPIMEKYDENRTDYTQNNSSLLPEYDEIIRQNADQYVADEYKERYYSKLCSENLIRCYTMGNTMQEYFCKIYNTAFGWHYCKYKCFLSKNSVTGDVISMNVVFDRTKQIEAIKSLQEYNEIIESTAADYDTILQIDLDSGCMKMFKMTKAFKELTENEPGISFRSLIMKYAKEYVMSEDVERLLSDTQYSNIHDKLSRRSSYSIHFRTTDNAQWMQMRFLRNHQDFEDNSVTCIMQNVTEEKTEETVVNNCIEYIGRIMDPEQAFDSILTEIGHYYEADRAYICELKQEGTVLVNTYEWCDNGIAPEKENLQDVPYEACALWFDEFRRVGAFYISALSEDVDKNSLTYEILESQGINSLIAAPLIEAGEMKGFIGVDNPRSIHDGIRVLNAIAVLSYSEILNREQKQKDMKYLQELKESKLQAEIANKSKSDFLLNMSHDIRTPMNAITGYTSMARKYATEPDKYLSYLGKIETSSHQLQSLLNQVLEMSCIESGKIILEEMSFDILDKNNAMQTVISVDAESKGLNYECSAGNIVHRKVRGDESRIDQVVLNILSNSIKYTEKGGSIQQMLEEQECDRPGYGKYIITISDTGIGMSPEYLAHIFDEFSRENSSTVTKIQGTGLGMAIVKKLVDLMEGTIDVFSEKGVGTTTILTFYLKLDENEPGPDNNDCQEPSEMNTKMLEGMKILVVEDNEMNREITTDILEEYGIDSDTAEDGDIAVEKIKASQPGDYDLILMDIQMPRMNGYDATRAIRKMQDNALSTVPIVALTANAFEEDRKNAFAAGMNEHLAKPIDIERLLQVLMMFRS